MKNDSLLAVVNVKIVRNNVLAQNEPVLKSLNRNIAENIVVILISRHHKSYRIAGIFKQFLSKNGISHVFIQAELAIAHPHTADILKIRRALGGVHLVLVQMYAKLEIRHGKMRQTEMSLAPVALGGGVSTRLREAQHHWAKPCFMSCFATRFMRLSALHFQNKKHFLCVVF